MQYHYIKQHSELPELRMELINDGRSDYRKFYDAIQDATITFTMTDVDTNVVRVANAPCYIKKREGEGCVEEYVICYKWKKRDTRDKGTFSGELKIHFNGNLTAEDASFPEGDLIAPIREPLMIVVE